ncbi:MAG: tripartite tricarboxylate transporter substrate-binding protein, partial [Xanthobacteraceae bacterium]
DIIARLNGAINKVLKTPKVETAFEKITSQPAGGTPAQFGALVTSQVALWAKVIKDANLKVQQ